MAAITPTSVERINMGSVDAIIATFADTADTGDTWASGITGIKLVVPVQNGSVSTQASAGVGASWSGSTITIHLGEDNTAVKLLVLF